MNDLINRCKVIWMIMAVMFTVSLLSMPVRAAEMQAVAMKDTDIGTPAALSFFVEVQTDPESDDADENYLIELTSLDGEQPLPGGGEGKYFYFTIDRNSGKETEELIFHEPGIYRYCMKQMAGDTPGMRYSERVYEIEICVYQVSGSQRSLPVFDTSVVITTDDASEKQDRLLFVNNWEDPQSVLDNEKEEQITNDPTSEPTEPSDGDTGSGSGDLGLLHRILPKTGDEMRPDFWIGVTVLLVIGNIFLIRSTREKK